MVSIELSIAVAREFVQAAGAVLLGRQHVLGAYMRLRAAPDSRSLSGECSCVSARSCQPLQYSSMNAASQMRSTSGSLSA
jgi:hypothetical protein